MADMRFAVLLAHRTTRIVHGRCFVGCVSSQSKLAKQQCSPLECCRPPTPAYYNRASHGARFFSAEVEEEIAAPAALLLLRRLRCLPPATRADAINRAVPVVRDQQGAILHLFDVHRTAEIVVVGDEAGEEGLH